MDKYTKALRSESKILEPSIIIGKNGLNDEVIKSIKKVLDKQQLIKIKILATYIGDKNKKEVAQEIATACDAKLIDLVGFTVVIAKK